MVGSAVATDPRGEGEPETHDYTQSDAAGGTTMIPLLSPNCDVAECRCCGNLMVSFGCLLDDVEIVSH